MAFLPFFEWLENTPGSVAIRESILFYPLVETTHVLTLCLFLGMTAMWDLRILGLAMRRVPVSQVGGRLLPFAVAGFVLMVTSGGLLFYSGPVRAAQNIFFQVKMVMIVLAGLNAFVFHQTVYRRVADWDQAAVTPFRARVAGFLSLVLWAGVVVAGRMQAYNWFD
jgi:hypothetical protein